MTPTEALAAAMCDARFHTPMWGHISPAQREPWMREATRVLAELERVGWRVVVAGDD